MSYSISLIVCTHNPRRDNLAKVLEGLKLQDFPLCEWELLLIDNASSNILSSEIDLTWHPHAQHVREDILGLTAARLRGFKEARADILVFVDDDNVLCTDFLSNVSKIVVQHPQIGALGGRVLPDFEVEPEKWIRKFDNALAIRDFGNIPLCCESSSYTDRSLQYPYYAPIGAGLVLRKQAANVYIDALKKQSNRLSFGRSGKQLTSGEDNDIILTVLESGWGVGYFPQLHLTHLISADRTTKDYLARLNYASSRSWVRVLNIHGIRPWKKISRWSVLPRKIKAFFTYQPWKSDEAFVRWKGACGLFEGLATL